MRVTAALSVSLLFGLGGLAACSSRPASPPVAPAVADVAPPPPPAPGVVGGPVGQSLDEKDRETAIAAQQEAVSSGARKSWRGEKGSYGIVTPGPETGDCREYTHRIFVNGRPQEAKGQACRADGDWRVKS